MTNAQSLYLSHNGRDYVLMLGSEALYIAEGTHYGNCFAFSPYERLEIRPLDKPLSALDPLSEHVEECRKLLRLHTNPLFIEHPEHEEAN